MTASQQLVPAMFALAMITRPLLAVGLPLPDGEGVDLDVDVSDDAVKAEARVRPALHPLAPHALTKRSSAHALRSAVHHLA